MHTDLIHYLERWLRRMRVVRSAAWASKGLAAGLAAALLVAVYGLLTMNVLAAEFRLAVGASAAAGLLAGLVAGFAWPISHTRAARTFDRVFNLMERVSTAMEVAGRVPADPMGDLLYADAVKHASAVDAGKSLPVRLPRSLLWIIFVLLCANAVVWFRADALLAGAAEKRQIQEAIQAQAEQIEALIEEIEQNPALTEEQAEALTQPLEQALEDLAEADTLEEAYSALEETRQELEALENPDAEALAEALRSAGEDLASAGGESLQPAGESLAEGDFGQAAEDLRQVDPSSMDQVERDQLAEDLESLAEAVEAADPDLAQDLREAAEAARAGDAAGAQQALEQAAQELEALQQQAAASQAAGDAAAGVQSSQQAVAQAGQQSDGVPADAQGEGDGSGEGAGGAGSGDGSGESTQGGEAGTDPISQGNNPDGTGISGLTPIEPSSIGGEGSDSIALPPSGETGEQVTGEGATDPGSTAPITVPYLDVLPQYQSAASQAIESGDVPPQYRDLIRDYFSSLEP